MHLRRFIPVSGRLPRVPFPSLMLFLLLLPALSAVPSQAADNQIQQIANYLLGRTADSTGLDLNGDRQVDVNDILFVITQRAPAVTAFALAGGAPSSTSPQVTLDNACTGNPQSWMASESPTFSGAAWQPYAAAPVFTLSAGNVLKTVYFRVLDVNGKVSPVVSDTIALAQVVTLSVGAPPTAAAISPAGDVDTYRFTAATTSTYQVATLPGTLADNYLRLYGPDSATTLVAQDHNSGPSHTARVALTLRPGAYLVTTQAYAAAATGSYTIQVSALGALRVNAFTPNGGAAVTTQRAITLNNVCSGSPRFYMASESPAFAGASWLAYAAAPPFTLSAGNLLKTVYFKVQDSGGTVSPVVSANIRLAESVTLTVGDPATAGAISPAGDVDAYQFTVSATSTYTIETFPGTLSDNYLRLYGPNSATTLLAQDHNSSGNGTARISQTLTPGTYALTTQAFVAGVTGSYTIRVTDAKPLQVKSFALNAGAGAVTTYSVTLNNACDGSPVAYQASESSSFKNAAWRPYSAAPGFTLSAGNGDKKVYFRVKDGAGVVSSAVSDKITLTAVTALPTDGTPVGGTIADANDENWFAFTVSSAGFYSIQTYASSLSDTIMGLSGVINPSSGDWIAKNDNISDSYSSSTTDYMSRITVWLTPGTYYVMVMSGTTDTGDYTIAVRQPEGQTLALNGATRVGNLIATDDENWYQITIGNAGLCSLVLSTSSADTLSQGTVELFSGTSAKIGLDYGSGTDSGKPALSSYLAPGTYLVRVTGHVPGQSDALGTYSIKAVSTPFSGATVALQINGATASGVLDMSTGGAYSTNEYQLIIPDNTAYTLKASAGGLRYGLLTLYYPDPTDPANPASTRQAITPDVYDSANFTLPINAQYTLPQNDSKAHPMPVVYIVQVKALYLTIATNDGSYGSYKLKATQ